MNSAFFRGFKDELTKTADLDAKGGLQGATLGALIGAVLGGISPHILAKMMTRNADLVALLGGLVGAGAGAVGGSLLGKIKVQAEQQKAASQGGAAEAIKTPGVGVKPFATPKADAKLGNIHGVEHASSKAFVKKLVKV